MAAFAIGAGAIAAIAWIVFDGTLPLVISIVVGALIAIKATLGSEDE